MYQHYEHDEHDVICKECCEEIGAEPQGSLLYTRLELWWVWARDHKHYKINSYKKGCVTCHRNLPELQVIDIGSLKQD